MTSLKTFVTEILRSRDFQVTEREGFLHAKKGEGEVVFCLIGLGEERSLPAFLDKFRGFSGKKVVVSLGPLPKIPMERLQGQVIFWGREALEQEIGRMHIERLTGEKDYGLVDELVADDYPKMVSEEELAQLHEAEVGERIIKPAVSAQDVKEIGMRTVGGFRHQMELVPYHVFDYACSVFSDGERLALEKGRMAVNALTGKPDPWPEKFEVVYSLEQGHRRLEPRLNRDVAEDVVRDEIVRVHAHEREFVREEGQARVTEMRKVVPKREDIDLASEGIFYLPIWCVEGVRGVVIINAATGKIISEDHYKV